MLKDNLFSYYISKKEMDFTELPKKHTFGNYIVFTDSSTQYSTAQKGNCECAIFGIAVNVISGEYEDLPEKILETCNDICQVVEYEKQLGGKYVLLYKNNSSYYIQGDATCSVPVFYSTDNESICTSNYQYILKSRKCTVKKEYKEIRDSGDISQAMPYDITPYSEIKQLIPNHYLDMNKSAAVRFVNSAAQQKTVSIKDATEKVKPMIEKMVDYYSSLYKLYCPITAGRDSRVVLAFLLGGKKDFLCYTMKHTEHRGDEQDIVLSEKLCDTVGVCHELIEDAALPQEIKESADSLFGADAYSLRTMMLAHTVKMHYGDGAILTGDIIGQVGKCSLHRDIPSFFATPSYFRCKLHNYSKGAKLQLKKWLEEIKASGEKVNTFDLFSIENRLGRWAGQENLLYNSAGQVYLNIFNSRSIIYIWTAVDRKKRKVSLLHEELIESICPHLLAIPYETETNIFVKLSKANGLCYWLASYLKYFVDREKFMR